MTDKSVARMKAELLMRRELPHLYGLPWYAWAWDFVHSRNKDCILTAGNQLSKSSSQIRKCIHWATSPELWDELWPNSLSQPNLFWYFYPTQDVATEEFELKWQQFLPQGSMKDHKVYGWQSHYRHSKIYRLSFNSGITVIFKAYSQKVSDLQTGSVFAAFADEELPLDLYPEIRNRLNATEGYFNSVFTATIGQDFWRRAVEGQGNDETLPHADKWQVSIFDCHVYRDGTPSPWTLKKIKDTLIRNCMSGDNARLIEATTDVTTLRDLCEKMIDEPEIQRRAMGKFIFVGGRKFQAFLRQRSVIPYHLIPSNWLTYCGLDYGSGGEKGHPSALCFVAVSPDFKAGRVFLSRRMDGVVTTAADVIDEYERLVREKNLTVTGTAYDWAAKDLHTIASRRGVAFVKAEKGHEIGVTTLNTLFKSGMLKIFEGDLENEKLITELVTLQDSTRKADSDDNLIDALRYCVMQIPWDWSAAQVVEDDEAKRMREPEAPKPKTEIEIRREFFNQAPEGEPDDLDFWAELMNED